MCYYGNLLQFPAKLQDNLILHQLFAKISRVSSFEPTRLDMSARMFHVVIRCANSHSISNVPILCAGDYSHLVVLTLTSHEMYVTLLYCLLCGKLELCYAWSNNIAIACFAADDTPEEDKEANESNDVWTS